MTISGIKIGLLVRIYNQEHIWHNEIGIVREVGLIFSRIELLGKLIWMPNHWLVEVDEGQPDVKGA
jgi:hypothetical protein